MNPRPQSERDSAMMTLLAFGLPLKSVAAQHGISQTRLRYIRERFVSEQNQQLKLNDENNSKNTTNSYNGS